MTEKTNYLEVQNQLEQLQAENKALREEKLLLERKLACSEEQFLKLFRHDNAIKLLIHPESGEIVDANQSAIKFYRYSKDKLLGKRIQEINVLDEHQVKEEMQKVKEQKRNYFIFKHQIANGDVKDVQVYSLNLEYNNKQYLFSIIHDITDQKKMEETLLQKRLLLNESEKISKTGGWQYVVETQHMHWTKGLYAIHDLDPEQEEIDHINKSLKCYLPEDRKRINELFEACVKYGKSYDIEVPFVSFAKNRKWIRTRAVPVLNQGKVIKVIGNVLDITDIKNANQQLQISENRLKEAEQISRSGHYVFFTQSGTWESSPMLDNIFGIDQYYNRSFEGWLQIIHPDFRELMNIYFVNEVLTGKTEFDKHYKILNQKTSEAIWVHGKGKLKFGDSGEVLEMFGTIQDINQRKKDEEALRELNKELSIASAEKDKLFSIIAHDLKSPYSALLGYARLMVKETTRSGNEKLEGFSRNLLRTAESSYDLLLNLLEWAMMQTGKIEFNPEQFNVNELLLKIEYLYESSFRAKNLRFKHSNDGVELLTADRQMIYTVLRNLISNAIKFTSSGGEIKIHVEKTSQWVKIHISDTGMGIPKKSIGKLFDISANMSTKGTENEKGTGIGLLLCNDFVKAHGGNIHVDSELGKGSTFAVNLPLNV